MGSCWKGMQAGCIFQEAERTGEISDYKDNRIGWLLLSATRWIGKKTHNKWLWVIHGQFKATCESQCASLATYKEFFFLQQLERREG